MDTNLHRKLEAKDIHTIFANTKPLADVDARDAETYTDDDVGKAYRVGDQIHILDSLPNTFSILSGEISKEEFEAIKTTLTENGVEDEALKVIVDGIKAANDRLEDNVFLDENGILHLKSDPNTAGDNPLAINMDSPTFVEGKEVATKDEIPAPYDDQALREGNAVLSTALSNEAIARADADTALQAAIDAVGSTPSNIPDWEADTEYTAGQEIMASHPETGVNHIYTRTADGTSGTVFNNEEKDLWGQIGEVGKTTPVLESLELTFRGYASSWTTASAIVLTDGSGTPYSSADWTVIEDTATTVVGVSILNRAFSPPTNGSRTIKIAYSAGAQRRGLSTIAVTFRSNAASTGMTQAKATNYDGSTNVFNGGGAKQGRVTFKINGDEGWDFITQAALATGGINYGADVTVTPNGEDTPATPDLSLEESQTINGANAVFRVASAGTLFDGTDNIEVHSGDRMWWEGEEWYHELNAKSVRTEAGFNKEAISLEIAARQAADTTIEGQIQAINELLQSDDVNLDAVQELVDKLKEVDARHTVTSTGMGGQGFGNTDYKLESVRSAEFINFVNLRGSLNKLLLPVTLDRNIILITNSGGDSDSNVFEVVNDDGTPLPTPVSLKVGDTGVFRFVEDAWTGYNRGEESPSAENKTKALVTSDDLAYTSWQDFLFFNVYPSANEIDMTFPQPTEGKSMHFVRNYGNYKAFVKLPDGQLLAEIQTGETWLIGSDGTGTINLPLISNADKADPFASLRWQAASGNFLTYGIKHEITGAARTLQMPSPGGTNNGREAAISNTTDFDMQVYLGDDTSGTITLKPGEIALLESKGSVVLHKIFKNYEKSNEEAVDITTLEVVNEWKGYVSISNSSHKNFNLGFDYTEGDFIELYFNKAGSWNYSTRFELPLEDTHNLAHYYDNHYQWVRRSGNNQTIQIRSMSEAGHNLAKAVVYKKKTIKSITSVAPEDIPVNDQAESGYMDIGDMRMQWGTANDTPSATFPVPFKDGTTPAVTLTPLRAGDNLSPTLQTVNHLNFNAWVVRNENDVGQNPTQLHWQAIGLKP